MLRKTAVVANHGPDGSVSTVDLAVKARQRGGAFSGLRRGIEIVVNIIFILIRAKFMLNTDYSCMWC